MEKTRGSALIKGGSVVDGTGAPARPQDVRIVDGRITELGTDLQSHGEPVYDASGCYVTPGFIDSHTHYDASVFWDPRCDPITHYGVTTILIGNCGLGLAPIKPECVADLSALFSYIEDLPRDVFEDFVPWNWESFPEYMAAMESRSFGLNVITLVSHSLLRLFVMGGDAWKRAATSEERTQIAALADEAMRAGAFGLSTSRFDRSPTGDLVPSFFADDAELDALFAVVGEHGGIVQMIPDMQTLDSQVADLRRLGSFAAKYSTPLLSNAISERHDKPEYATTLIAAAKEIRAAGAPFKFLASPRSHELIINFYQGMVFMYVPAWNDVLQANLSADEKKTMLADPAWRARARHDWDTVKQNFPSGGMERLFRIIKVGKPELEMYLGKTFDVILDQRPGHVSDVLADWVLENHLDTEFVYPFSNTDHDIVGSLIAADECFISAGDAGAHIGMFDGAGDTALVLTRHVRDRGDMTLEVAVKRMTLDQAEVLRLRGRGVIALDKIGDVAVFDLKNMDWVAEKKVFDIPGGRPRFRRDSSGFRYTFVEGVLVQQDGTSTDALPARMLASEDRGLVDA